MQTEKDIRFALAEVEIMVPTAKPYLTYEEGVDEALSWVLGEITDSEFDYSPMMLICEAKKSPGLRVVSKSNDIQTKKN